MLRSEPILGMEKWVEDVRVRPHRFSAILGTSENVKCDARTAGVVLGGHKARNLNADGLGLRFPRFWLG